MSSVLADKGSFSISVMGRSVKFAIHENEKLATPSEHALRETHNNTDLTKWVLKTGSGKELSFTETERQAGIRNGDELFLSPKIGAGGV
jgi:hypothetical protein